VGRERTDWRREPQRPRGHRLDPASAGETWATFLRHLATMSASEAAKQPGMPSRVAFLKKRRRDPDFEARTAAVMAGRRLETSGRKRIAPEAWAALLARLPTMSVARIAALDGMPSEAAVYKRRAADPRFRAQLDAVLSDVRRVRDQRIARGLRFAEQRQDPAFVARMLVAIAAWHMGRPTTGKPRRGKPRKTADRSVLGERFTAALLKNDLYAVVEAAVPASLSPQARADVISDLVLAVLEGELEIGAIASAVKEYTKRHWRMFGTFGTVSLDAKLGPDSRETIGDRLHADTPHF
jgi:hypothetical protein